MMEKCMWCITSLDVQGDAAIRSMLQRYSSGQLSEHEISSLNEDLSCCMECVVEYHRARDHVPKLHQVLWEMEKARLVRVFRSVLNQKLEEDDVLFIIEDDHEEPVSTVSPTEFLNSLRFPLFEVLKYPYLLCHSELCDLVVKILCMLQDMKQPLNVFEKYQGTYLLLVHPNEKVRHWAIEAAKSMKSVDRDSYYELQEIFSCMFYVVELGICLDFPDLDLDSYAGGRIPRLPSHLYDSHNRKNYWLGICMLLTQLSAEAMDSLFTGPFEIPLCILNTMDELKREGDPASDPFWPALHCFMVILDRFGSKIWGQVDPNVAFQAITGAASYTAELRCIQQNTMGGKVKVEPECDDNVVTCSQMVYDCYTSEETSQTSSSSSSSGMCNSCVVYEDMQCLVNVLDSEMGQSMRVYGSTFLWFIPFVRSIMELPDSSYISEVIHYLCHKIRDNRHMLTGQAIVCDKVTELFIHILIQIVQLHYSNGQMGILARCGWRWVEVIVMCTVQSDEVLNAGAAAGRMGRTPTVSSTACAIGGVIRPPAPGDDVAAIITGCMSLIRLLLREGLRTRCHPRSAHYLNILNKHLRGVPIKRWNLTKSQSDELERCLRKAVQSVAERPAAPVSDVYTPSTPSVDLGQHLASLDSKNKTSNKLQQRDQEGPSRAGDACALIKEEPLWDCFSDEEFCSGLEDIVKVKKEPLEPVLISALSPAVELAHSKPDPGKLQKSPSRLNVYQNLLKIEAIAQRKSSKPEVRQCSISSGKKELDHSPVSSHSLFLKRVVSNPVHLAEAQKGCGFKGNDDPLDGRMNHLKKTWKQESSDSEVVISDKGQKHTKSMCTLKKKSSTIILSDDEVCENDVKPTKEKSPEGPVFTENPGQDHDDLSKSQVFEFETQQYMSSAWGDSDFNASAVTSKSKLEAFDSNEGSPSWRSDTELVPDEDIERACQQAEEKIRQQQLPQEPEDPKTQSLSNQNIIKGDQRANKQSINSTLIEALAHTVRHNPRKRSCSSWDVEKQPSNSASSSVLPTPSSSISSAYFSASVLHDIPAVVPQKKACKAFEPKSTVAHLGLKTKERKAFNLSQNSMYSITELREHGQKVQVGPQQTRRRVCRTIKSFPQKCMVKGNKTLLASQDMQFFRQSREHQRSTVTNKPLFPVQAPHVSKSTDSNIDELFLKPGMPPMSQRKAKPSTTKMYNTPSSRSASLVLQMEKGDKPPLAAKAKVTRLAPAVPPLKTTTVRSSQFRQPLPLKQAPLPLNHDPRSVFSTKISCTSEPPSYKTYQRREAPVHRPVPTMDQSHRFDLSVLTQAVLKWDYRMLDNYKMFGSPDDLCQLPLTEVPVKFSSYLEYFNTLYPLLLLNAFEEMASEWLKEGRVKLFAKVQSIEYSNRIASVSFIAGLTPESEMKLQFPKEDDLVLLWLPENIGSYTHDRPDFHEPQPHVGYVSRSSVSSRGPGLVPVLNMTVQTGGNVSSVNGQPVKCEVIGSLISTCREFRALCLLRNGPMLRSLLAPHESYLTHRRDVQIDMPEYNSEQSRAIACALAMMKRTQKTPQFLLIHGPPGTGKSKTISGLLYQLLSSVNSPVPAGNFPSKSRRTRVLLCAPSNAAIDSLMKKVIVLFKEKCCNNTVQGNCGDINLVRLGSEKTMSKSLKAFSLDHQTRARAQRAQQTVEADVQRQKGQMDQNIDILSQHCARTSKDSLEFKKLTERKMQLLKEREALSQKIKEYWGKRQESQTLVLQNAHVICCTLSTSGSSVLENAFRRLGHEPFSCVIIDEASQAKETETLIPMLYRCPAVILVGDPNQLPPTVVSMKAKELGYDQSLMARLCKSLHQANVQPSPVFLLSVQYRMHPDICAFPSKYIYNNTLKNDCEKAQKRCCFSWPFRPYRVFDVTDGRENREGDSFINPKEVKLVLLLLKLLGEKQSVCVGVITPYNAQKQRILQAIRELCLQKRLQVEVDTVDGFQGREKDCIIVSCVRASSEMGSIGFVGNRQRMNVTITRAKFSLFILGHLRTLREQSDWGALIKDAGRRGTIIRTHERDFHSDARKILKQDTLSRSLSHPTVSRPSTVTSPVTHSSVKTALPSTSHSHLQQQMPCLIPLDCPDDSRMSNRPTDPRWTEHRPVRVQRQDTKGRGLSVSHQSMHRDRVYGANYPNTGHSSQEPSKRRRYSSPKPHRR